MAERDRRDNHLPARKLDKRGYTGTVPTDRIPVPSYTGPAAGARPGNKQRTNDDDKRS